METILLRHTKELSFEDGTIAVDDPIAPVLARSLFRIFATAPMKDVDGKQVRAIAAHFETQIALADACQAEFTRVFGELEESPTHVGS